MNRIAPTAPPAEDIKTPYFDLEKNANYMVEQYILALKDSGQDIMECGVVFDLIYDEYFYPEFGVILREQELPEDVLGQYIPDCNTAYIDPSLKDNARKAWTQFHEVVGHGILQGDWLRKRFPGRVLTESPETLSDTSRSKLEIQANKFAALVAMPMNLLHEFSCRRFRLARPIRFIGPSSYTLDICGFTRNVRANSYEAMCRIVAYHIKDRFGGLSTEAISYRVMRSGIVENHWEESPAATQRPKPLETAKQQVPRANRQIRRPGF